jgi:hypothetical protein
MSEPEPEQPAAAAAVLAVAAITGERAVLCDELLALSSHGPWSHSDAA